MNRLSDAEQRKIRNRLARSIGHLKTEREKVLDSAEINRNKKVEK